MKSTPPIIDFPLAAPGTMGPPAAYRRAARALSGCQDRRRFQSDRVLCHPVRRRAEPDRGSATDPPKDQRLAGPV